QCSDTVSQLITVKNFNYAFSISATFIGNGGHCAPAIANFTNTSTNYTRLIWDFGDGFTLENQSYPSHIYKDPGTYIVTLFVYGFNGLTGTYKDTIKINSSAATINSDITEGCTGLQVKLNAPVHNNTSTYAWDFGDGNVVNTTDSFAVHKYPSAGIYSPSLISTDVNGCSSSIALTDKITIRPDPVVIISPANPILCKGNSVQLLATGAVSYSWSPAEGLSNSASASPNASPVNTSTYTVNATDDKGCTGIGSVTITVAQPFKIQTNPDASICAGSSLSLNTSGAELYKWINETTGLSSTQIANPLASPTNTTNYTVVGYDQYQCFTDTGFVKITVNPLPSIEAGPDLEAIIGSDLQLHPSASSDVVSWAWSPADYLSCTNCASPVSKPRAPVDYTITVTNQYNCSAKDNVKINVSCAGGQVYIPGAFSPNNDGKNDRFIILGNGVRTVKSLRIFNRWGEMVFERKNFYPDDASAAWDGTYKNFNAPAGIYVYIAELECTGDDTFTRKGTVTLIR
ncbi:MAG: PKD domain-containing protein, partial [Bacteroidota bacterium]